MRTVRLKVYFWKWSAVRRRASYPSCFATIHLQ